MKAALKNHLVLTSGRLTTLLVCMLFSLIASGFSAPDYTEFSGKIVDKKTGIALAHATVSIKGTNIAVVTNADGQFLLKLPKNIENPQMSVSYIGYKVTQVSLMDMTEKEHKIELESAAVQLPMLSVSSRDATVLIRSMLDQKAKNYSDSSSVMTAFYRESIRKNRTYVSLAEAVAEINKQSYLSTRPDAVRLFKSRKKTDYSRLDTLNFKLMGGPFNSLYLDVVKYTENLFTEDVFNNYDFSFDKATYIDKQPIYIVDFKQKKDISAPLYYGKLYIDGETMALRSAVFDLNISDKDEAAKLFIMKKPFNARVYPLEAKYRIDYREKDGKWYYSYSRIELGLRISWKRRLFNTTYYSTVEMAVTDFGHSAEKKSIAWKDKIKPSVIIADEASGFTEHEFWGEFNVIEPEKPIDAAIRKIQKQLEKEKE